MSISDMREPTFFILSSLAGGKKHGYALISDTTALSDGRVVLKVGTLYAALDRLSGEALIREAGEEVIDGRLRRYYELTDHGAEALSAEAGRIQARARKAMTRLAARAEELAI